jgi:peptide-methionine (S)-S-oxide reductase
MARTKIATFAAGCFWGPEARFRRINGVVDAAVGYMGGHVKNPTYQMVCTDGTGHAEVVQVTYDPAVISYEQLLEAFWQMHDPTTPDRQGFDFGSQYRSAIFYHDENQHEAAEASKKRLNDSGQLGDPIVTEIVAEGPFYRAEEYHQRYLEKTGQEDHC